MLRDKANFAEILKFEARQIKIAKGLKKEGIPVKIISKYTDLTIEEIENLDK